MKRYQLATPNQKKQFQILPLPSWLYRCKKFKVWIDSRDIDIDDQRILQSDLLRAF